MLNTGNENDLVQVHNTCSLPPPKKKKLCLQLLIELKLGADRTVQECFSANEMFANAVREGMQPA